MLRKVVLQALFVITILKHTIAQSETDFASLADDVKQNILQIYNRIVPTGIIEQNFSADNISYYLFTKDKPNDYEQIDPSNPYQIDSKSFIVFFVHGWTESRSTLWYQLLNNSFMERASYYSVVQVDWSPYAELNYPSAANSTKAVGNVIGEFILNLVRDRGVAITNILMIGYSLGAQICGFTGKKVQQIYGQTLPRIIALDPAGPLFQIRPESARLNPNDAKVVHVIHTNGGVFGYLGSCGTIDFFPNGGTDQNGCTEYILTNIENLPSTISCHHARSWRYLVEGLTLEDKFVSKKCSFYLDYKMIQMTCSEKTASLGLLNLNFTGKFYLDTHSRSPYSIDEND